MAYSCDIDYGSHQEIATKMADLLNSASITTLHSTGIAKVGTDFFAIWIIYE